MSDKNEPAVDVVHDVLNEQIVIAAVFGDPKVAGRYLETVRHDLFGDEKNAAIWRAMAEVRRRKLKLDAAAVLAELKGAVPKSYLDNLVRSFPKRPANLTQHVENLKWDGTRVSVVNGPLSDLLRAFQDPKASPSSIKGLARAVSKALDTATETNIRNPKAVARGMVAAVRDRRGQAIYPTGIDDLDVDEDGVERLVPGLAPQKVTALTATSGSGKSTIAAKIALEQARRERRVLYGAWEMTPEETMELMTVISLHEEDPDAGWTRDKVLLGKLTDHELAVYQRRAEQIGTFVRFFPPPVTGKSHDNNRALDEIYERVVQFGADVTVFDLWERILVNRRPEAERDAMIRQQQMAKDTNCHMLLCCQQKTKEVESRDDKRPTRGDIFGSSVWIDVPDTIIGVYRPSLYESVADDAIEIHILKQRYSKRWPCVVEFDWDASTVQMMHGREIEYRNPHAKRSRSFEGIGDRR